jgi:hypothetical protein
LLLDHYDLLAKLYGWVGGVHFEAIYAFISVRIASHIWSSASTNRDTYFVVAHYHPLIAGLVALAVAVAYSVVQRQRRAD